MSNISEELIKEIVAKAAAANGVNYSTIAPSRCTMRPAARRRSDTRIAYGGEVSFLLRHLRSDGTSMNSLVPFPKSRKRMSPIGPSRRCPLWVKSRLMRRKNACPLYSQ
jgi:hypothetical protein